MKRIIFSILIYALSSHLYADVNNCEQYSSLVDKINNCLEGVNITDSSQNFNGTQTISMTITQPQDHFDDQSENFKQRIVLLHRKSQSPMVLHTSGYNIFSSGFSEPAQILNGNQITVEHRFFNPSRPDNPDWSKLNILQSANDFHKITETFKKIYPMAWVNTGASKGGMTSVYHRRFFPNDLVGTIAYVAPLSFSTDEQNYNDFLNAVGGGEYYSCREKLVAMQREITKRKNSLSNLLNGSFSRLGGKSNAIQIVAAELRFIFWQYQDPTACNNIPSAQSSDQSIYRWLNSVAHVQSFYVDSAIEKFGPYFYQAKFQLGAPAIDLENIFDLIGDESVFSLDQYLPLGQSVEHTSDAIFDVDDWVQNESERIMYLYGEFDPWTAGSFRLGSSTQRDSHYFVVSKGNHSALLKDLSSQDFQKAKSILHKWTNSVDTLGRNQNSLNSLPRQNITNSLRP